MLRLSSDSRRRLAPAALSSVLVLTLLGSAIDGGAQDEVERVRFGFAPVDGTVWIEQMEDEQIYDYGDVAPSRTQVTEGSARLLFEAQEDGGWVVAKTSGPITMDMGAGPVDNPIAEQTLGHTFRILLDSDGNALSVDGCRELVRKLERKLDIETWEKFQATQSAAAIEGGEIRLWNRRLRGVQGAEVAVGEVWRVVDERRVQGRPVLITGVVRFDGWTEIKGQRGFKVLYDFDTTQERVQELGEGYDGEVDWRPEGSQAGRSNLELRGNSIRVIQPDTGQLLYESTHVEYEAPMGKPEGPKARVEQNTSYRYRLDDGEQG